MTVKKSKFKTDQQFLQIVESMDDGNWDQAADQCVEYHFYYDDLKTKYRELDLNSDIWGFVLLIESATEKRSIKYA